MLHFSQFSINHMCSRQNKIAEISEDMSALVSLEVLSISSNRLQTLPLAIANLVEYDCV